MDALREKEKKCSDNAEKQKKKLDECEQRAMAAERQAADRADKGDKYEKEHVPLLSDFHVVTVAKDSLAKINKFLTGEVERLRADSAKFSRNYVFLSQDFIELKTKFIELDSLFKDQQLNAVQLKSDLKLNTACCLQKSQELENLPEEYQKYRDRNQIQKSEPKPAEEIQEEPKPGKKKR